MGGRRGRAGSVDPGGLRRTPGFELDQERASARQGAIFAERLKADLRHEDWVCQYLIDYNRQVLKSAGQAESGREGKTALPDEALLVSAYRATQYKQPVRRRSTYDELISTGT